MSAELEKITFIYHFKFQDHSEKVFPIALHPSTLTLEPAPTTNLPQWTALDCHQCSICPLKREEQPNCPVAVNIVPLIPFLLTMDMGQHAAVTVTTRERTYFKNTTLKEAASSLLGIYMVASGCPVLDKLRPMVRFHLPFLSVEESLHRTMTMYLMAQFLRQRNQLIPDWKMTDLPKIYANIADVNQAFHKRLQALDAQKHQIEAILNLECFTYYINLSLSGKTFFGIENLYKNY